MRESVSFVRYALGQLRARDGHHDFEALCRQLARETISRNVLPATGPVSAGGDQGRDFESYRSEVTGLVRPVGVTLGVQPSDAIAFACTLQQGSLKAKILSDVKTATASGTDVDWVIYYCETNLPVAHRHGIQVAAREAHDVHLEIFDGAAIAELLVQRRTIWIAQEWLHVPASLTVPEPERPAWYEDDLRRWRAHPGTASRIGDLYDLAGCLRYAWQHEDGWDDVQFWLDLTGRFLEHEDYRTRHTARYEVVIACTRGGAAAPGSADQLGLSMINEACSEGASSAVSDAVTLLSYLQGARVAGMSRLSSDAVDDCIARLDDRITELLSTTPSAGVRCELLEARVWLNLTMDLSGTQSPDVLDVGDPATPIQLPSPKELSDLIDDGWTVPEEVPVRDVLAAMGSLDALVSVLPDAPLYPALRLARMLTIFAPLLDRDERYQRVTSVIDKRVAEISGGSAAAALARDRAISLLGRERHVDALAELRRARLGWFSSEGARGLVLSCLLAARTYRVLGLEMAAKHMALTGAYLLQQDDMDLLAPCLMAAAEADFHMGAWVSASEFISLAWRAHGTLAEDPGNPERHDLIQTATFEALLIRAGARHAGPAYEELLEPTLAQCGVLEFADQLMVDLAVGQWWDTIGSEQYFAQTAAELGHPAFADCGSTRVVRWQALGVDWRVAFASDRETTLVGERLAAYLQHLVVLLARRDPALLPTRICFEVDLGSRDNDDAPEWDGEELRVHVSLARQDGRSPEAANEVAAETVATILTGLEHISVLPGEEATALIEGLFSDGLVESLLFGNAYDTVAADFVTPRNDDEDGRARLTPLGDAAEARASSPELLPRGPGPHYDKVEARNLIASRYDTIASTIPITLAHLRSTPAFASTVAELREEGWKDWHVLVAVFNIAQNARFDAAEVLRSGATRQQVYDRMMRPETDEDPPADPSLFGADDLRDAIRLAWAATLQVWGLRPPPGGFDIEALGRLLAERYNYWIDDIDSNLDRVLGPEPPSSR